LATIDFVDVAVVLFSCAELIAEDLEQTRSRHRREQASILISAEPIIRGDVEQDTDWTSE
jgi:hypothetical protein